MRFALLATLLLAGCFVTDGPNDGDTCANDDDCDSERCRAGTCSGSLCSCRIEDITFSCVNEDPLDSDECRDGWACVPGGTAGRCKLPCDAGCPDLWVCEDDEYCVFDMSQLPLPTVEISPGPTIELVPGESITLRANAMSDNGAIVGYTWDLGDGSDATGESVTHAYDSPGSPEVRVVVEDAIGLISSDIQRVTVCRGPGAACNRVGWGDLCCSGEACRATPDGPRCQGP